MYATLPPLYQYLVAEQAPKILLEMLQFYGLKEAPGDADNPVIVGWADEMHIPGYKHDATAWCGLTAAISAKRAGYEPPIQPLWALNWRTWGNPVSQPMLGDVLVYQRPEGGHVGLYVGEDSRHFHVLAGNQGDAVSIKPLTRATWTRGMSLGLVAVRRSPWRIGQPDNVRRVILPDVDSSNVKVS